MSVNANGHSSRMCRGPSSILMSCKRELTEHAPAVIVKHACDTPSCQCKEKKELTQSVQQELSTIKVNKGLSLHACAKMSTFQAEGDGLGFETERGTAHRQLLLLKNHQLVAAGKRRRCDVRGAVLPFDDKRRRLPVRHNLQVVGRGRGRRTAARDGRCAERRAHAVTGLQRQSPVM